MKLSIIFGLGMIIFGLVNFFRYLTISHSPTFWNKPFPFEHLVKVVPSEGRGTTMQIGYMPFEQATNDPYWLIWSLALYGGIILVGFSFWRKRKEKLHSK